MKIVVDITRFNESFLPDTGEYERSIEFMVAGVGVVLPVTEEQLAEALAEVTQGDDLASAEYVDKEQVKAEFTPTEYVGDLNEVSEDAYTDQQEPDVPVPFEIGMRSNGAGLDEVLDVSPAIEDVYGAAPEPVEKENVVAPLPGHKQRSANIDKIIATHTKKTPRQEAIERMREKARKMPPRRVEKDDMGYPVGVSQTSQARPTDDPNGPEIKRSLPEAGLGGLDDDGFPSA
jgi:hypothetical protein